MPFSIISAAIMAWISEQLSIFEPAVWVALFALLTTVVMSYQNWKHNRLSVIPNVDLNRYFLGKNSYINLESTGLGPAKIEKLTVTIEDKSFNLCTHKGLHNFLKDFGDEYISQSTVIGEGKFMPPNTIQQLFRFKEENPKAVALFMSHLSFAITFSSVYGEEFSESYLNVQEEIKSE